jgi:TonB family protein
VPQPSQTKIIPITPYKPAPPSGTSQIQACPATFESHPELDGIYKIDAGVKPPRPSNRVKAEFSEEARNAPRKHPFGRFSAVSLLSLVVDAEGRPQDICLKKSAGYGLDVKAFEAAAKYRFHPAEKDGVPVAVRISIEVNFRTF